jgi:hypothetical protein
MLDFALLQKFDLYLAKFGNRIKHSVVIPEVIGVENSHLKLLSNKFVHIHYGLLVLRLGSWVEFMNSQFEFFQGLSNIKFWN